jgi:hypothetical protein
MTELLISLAAAIISLGGLLWLAAEGFRLGDRPGDARITAVLRDTWQPDATRPVVAVTVRNPSGAAVLAGMSVRAGLPFRYGLLSARARRTVSASTRMAVPAPMSGSVPMAASVPATASVPVSVFVPRRTARRRFRAAVFGTVGVVPPGADVQFTVPVPREARGYMLTAVIGQRDRRLRVHRIALAQARPRARAPRLIPPVDTPVTGG